MYDKKIAVIGGDKRQKYLTDKFTEMGYKAVTFGAKDAENTAADLNDALTEAYAAVLPFPVSPDGVFLNAYCEDCNIRLSFLFSEIKRCKIQNVFGGLITSPIKTEAEKYGIEIYDYGENEEVKIKNALCTAEGAVEIALRELPFTLSGCNCCILGYGRIGRILAIRLRDFGCKVTVLVRRPESAAAVQCDSIDFSFNLASATNGADIVFNTVPTVLLKGDILSKIRKKSLIIDLASAPGGVDFAQAETLGLKVIWARSLPGKTAPQTAAGIIADAVSARLDKQ